MFQSLRRLSLLVLTLLAAGCTWAADAPRLVIVKAEYGELPAGAKADVTQTVAAAVKDNALSIAATNELFGDPAVGVRKTLRVDFTFAGTAGSKAVFEGETLVIKGAPGLQVVKAAYGDLDVTAKIQGLVKDQRLKLTVNDDTLGKAGPGAPKVLKITYTLGGDPVTRSVAEKAVLTIPRLVIVKAEYGDLPTGGKVDVTKVLAEKAINDSLHVQATNDLAGDPAEGIGKTLQVDYTLDGVAASKSVGENEALTIEAPAN